MKILNKFKGIIMAVMALGIFVTIGSKCVYATETDIASGIYEIENDVYHESETGMAMSRTYLLPSMSGEVTKEHVIYTIGFSGSDYMENYRMKVNGEEVPVEILEENSEEGTVKLNVEVDKVDADMAAIIYVGRMERDVVEEIVPEDESEEVEIEEENLAVVADNEKSSNNVILIIAGVAVVVAIGAVVIVKAKKK